MTAVNEAGKSDKGTAVAGGRPDLARREARKTKQEKPKPASPAGGVDHARQAALEGEQDGMSSKPIKAVHTPRGKLKPKNVKAGK